MNEKYVALSFDDGPNNIVSPAVLDRVEKYNVVATFFVNGKNISDDVKAVMDRALSVGKALSNGDSKWISPVCIILIINP